MNGDQIGRDLEAAAAVHGARRRVDNAIADLAARPLDEAVAEQMRQILDSPQLKRARRELRRLSLQQARLVQAIPDAPAGTSNEVEGGATVLPFRSPASLGGGAA